MAKNKNAVKEIKAIDKVISKLEYEWAKERGKRYPLSIGDRAQYQREELIKGRFQTIKYIFTKSRNHYMDAKSSIADCNSIRPWPLWTYSEVADDNSLYTLMPEAKMKLIVNDIAAAVRCSFAIDVMGFTEISLSNKSQSGKESSMSYDFDRAAIMLLPSIDSVKPKFLKIRDNEKVNATLYVGDDIDDKIIGQCEFSRIGFLVFANEDKQNHAVELEEFSAIIEIDDGNGYMFTYFSKTNDLLFTKHLTSLDAVGLFSDCYADSNTIVLPDGCDDIELIPFGETKLECDTGTELDPIDSEHTYELRDGE